MRIIKIVEGIVDGRGIIKVAIVAEPTLILNVERTMTSAMTKRRMTSAMIKTMRLY